MDRSLEQKICTDGDHECQNQNCYDYSRKQLTVFSLKPVKDHFFILPKGNAMHNVPVVFIIIVVTALFFKIFMNRSMRNYDPEKEFWERERKADQTPKKSVEDLPYIRVDPDALPLDTDSDDPEIREMQDSIRLMADKKILNFTGISNTDLKLEYGAANISFLTNCDMNYLRLVQNIARLSEKYIKNGHVDEAVTLLEYGIEIGTDVSKNYTLLAGIYVSRNEASKITGLLEAARDLNSLTRDGIISNLEKMKDAS